jgi:hypothetical protein
MKLFKHFDTFDHFPKSNAKLSLFDPELALGFSKWAPGISENNLFSVLKKERPYSGGKHVVPDIWEAEAGG